MKARRSSVLYLVTSLVLVATSLTGCSLSAPGQAAPTPETLPPLAAPSKPTFTVQRGGIVEEVTFTGRISPVREETLYFRTDGRVATVAVKEGDKVKKGDLLAELEISDLLNQLAQAQVTLDQAQIKLKNAQDAAAEQRFQLETALAAAQLRLAQAKLRDPGPSVAIAAANRDKAAAAVQAAQAAYDRRGQRGDSAEALNLERATLDYQIAQAQYELALQSQKTWEYDLQLLEQSVMVAKHNLDKGTISIDPLLSQDVAKAQLAVDRLKAQIDNARLVAPIDGDVSLVSVYAGRTIQAYRTAIVIAVPGALEVSADVMSDKLPLLSIGQKATMTLTNYPGRVFSGTIRRLPYPYGAGGMTSSSIVEEDRSTRITLDNPDVTLEKGALVRVSVVLQQKDDVLWLPPAAVRTFQGRDFVLVQDGDIQRRVVIKTGIKTEDKVEIVSGLTEGQIIIGP